MKFGYTIIYVDDVLNILNSYKEAFRFQEKFVHENNQYAELKTGSSTLAFTDHETANFNGINVSKLIKQDKNAPPFELAFVSDDVEKDYKKAIEAGAVENKKTAAKPWGQVVGYVKDNNGFLIELYSPIN